MIRVVLADDHMLFRQGLVGLLRAVPDLAIVGEAADGAALARLVAETQPDLAIVDVSMPLHDVKLLPGDWARRGWPTRLIVLTVHREPAVARPIIQSGVAGYVLKENAFEELLAAVRAVAAGGEFVSPLLAAQLLKAETVGGAGTEPLSPREVEVLRLIASGLANKQIARQLGLSVDTVRTHRMRLMKKLDLHSTADLTRHAMQRGLLPQA